MYLYRPPTTPRTPARIRRFRLAVGALVAATLVVLAPRAAGQPRLATVETSALCGLITGIVVMGVAVDRRFAALARRVPTR